MSRCLYDAPAEALKIKRDCYGILLWEPNLESHKSLIISVNG
jgi:hypothetical protein